MMTKKCLIFVVLCLSSAGTSFSFDVDPEEIQRRLSSLEPMDMDEVLWLARCIYSESDRADERRLVAWVVRNRVETRYRGDTYREVVLEPLQFSAFNAPSPRRTYLLSLDQHSTTESWLGALDIALEVYKADPAHRPISLETRHFYSPVSMDGGKAPPWAEQAEPVAPDPLGIDPRRFLFYEDIDEAADPYSFVASGHTPGDHIDTYQKKTRERLRPSARKSSLRDRWKPSGRVYRPARPGALRPRR